MLVSFGAVIGDAVQAQVWALDRVLADDPVPGQTEVVPAYVNLMVLFDPLVTDHAAVIGAVQARLGRAVPGAGAGALHEVAVTYGGAAGPDLEAVAQQTGLGVEGVIAAHLAGDYAVCLYGFAPGYAYLGGVPDAIRLPRKAAAVRGIPAGSVMIAGPQCIITTLTMPTGWWVIGRSDVQVLRPEGGLLFDVGDRVRFVRAGA